MTDIEDAFIALVNDIEGVQGLTYEPETLPARPCVTMLVSKTAQEDFATGNVTEGQYEWRVNLYVQLNNYKVAQDRMKELVPLLLRVTRLNPTLDHTCDWAQLTDSGAVPVFDSETGLLVKSLLLQAETTLAD